jgi:hypothetical protein
MPGPQITGNVFVATWILVAIVYDCWVYFVLGKPLATISDTLRSWVQWSPLVLVPLGGLLWHLFGNHQPLTLAAWRQWAPLLALVAGMALYALCGLGSFPDIGPPIN